MYFRTSLFLGLLFVFSFISFSITEVQALSIFDYASCKQTVEKLQDIGSYTYSAIFGNREAQRFCMDIFEKEITLREIREHHEIPRLGIQIELPENWSGFEVYDQNMTIAFVVPEKKVPSTIEPLWAMLVTNDHNQGEETSKKIYKLVEESLDNVPNLITTCNFQESTIVTINNNELKEEIVECIDRRLSLFVTISFYSSIVNETDVFFISATRHVPSISPEIPIRESLETLKISKSLNNTAEPSDLISETKTSDFPDWFKRYMFSWGMGEVTDRELISTLNFIFRNNIANESHYSTPGFYNQAQIPDWYKDNGVWFGKGHITEDEFKESFKYMIKNRIIII